MFLGQPAKDVLSAILFTFLFGFAVPVWSNLKRVRSQLDALQRSIKVAIVYPRVRSDG
jgi:hypothetical protein